MTPVVFTLVSPNGQPLVNAPVTIQLSKAGYDDTLTGVSMPRPIETVTDNSGVVTVNLWPLPVAYIVEVLDTDSEASLRYKFYVPTVPDGSVVRFQDIVVDAEMSTTPYDEAALVAIQDAKANAITARIAADADRVQTGLDRVQTGLDRAAADTSATSAAAIIAGAALRYDVVQGLTGAQKIQARSNIGLSNVDNTADANKPVSTAQAAADSAVLARRLKRTPVKAANYAAAATDLVPVDTTAGSVTITLPNAPEDCALVAVKHVIQGGTNGVTIAAAGADVFNKAAGSTSLSLPLLNQAAFLQYDATAKVWTVLSEDLPLAQLDSRYSAIAGLAATGGSSLVGYDSGTVQDVLDTAKPMASYTALRAYTGRATAIKITDIRTGGNFTRDTADTTSADNGGTIIVDASNRRWKRVFNGTKSVLWFGARGTGPGFDDTPGFAAAIAAPGKSVFVPYSGNYYQISAIDINRGDASLVCAEGTYITAAGTPDGTPVITLSGDFASLENVTVYPTNPNSPGIQTTGFRNRLENCFVSGPCSQALQIKGLETFSIFSLYSGAVDPQGLGGNVGAAIDIQAADSLFINVYTQNSVYGLYTLGVGSITAFHMHSWNNSKNGFYLDNAAFSQLTDCYADTNGLSGWNIRNGSSGLVLTNCWGFKSSNLVPASPDFLFIAAKNVKLIGCNSSGNGAFTKGGSFNFGNAPATSKIHLIGCYADSEPAGQIIGSGFFTGCTGNLTKYNRSDVVASSSSASATASGGTTAVSVPMAIDGAPTSPGVLAFEVSLVYRNTSGTQSGVEKKTIVIGLGGANTTIANIYPAAPGLVVSAASLNLISNGTYSLDFTVTNNLAYPIQLAATTFFQGTGRGCL